LKLIQHVGQHIFGILNKIEKKRQLCK
jgi:hypothetical protein